MIKKLISALLTLLVACAYGVSFVECDTVEPEVEIVEVKEILTPQPIFKEVSAPISDVVPLSWELQQAIVDNCKEYGLDIALVLGVIDAESDFRETADNGRCYGLMQINRCNKKWVLDNAGVTDIFDSAQNIRAGCWILSKGVEICDTTEQALVWYNAGRVYADSTTYSREVLREAEKWAERIANER